MIAVNMHDDSQKNFKILIKEVTIYNLIYNLRCIVSLAEKNY